MTTTTSDSTITELVDRFAIIELIGRQALDAVHHQITNHLIRLDGDDATCTDNMQGTHVLANATGGPMWTVGGRHIYQLKRGPEGWRISGLTFNLQWATGNMNVLTLSMAAGA